MQYFLGTRRIAERYLGSTLIYKHKEDSDEFIPVQPAPIIEIFPDTWVAAEIRNKLKKTSTSDIVTQEELDTITIFGYSGSTPPLTVNGTTNHSFLTSNITTLEGIQYLRNLRFFSVAASNTTYKRPDIIDISHCTKLESLNASFTNVVTSEIRLPEKYNPVVSMQNAFSGCTASKINLPDSWTDITNIMNIYRSCTNIDPIIFPTTWTKVERGIAFDHERVSRTHVPNTWKNLKELSYTLLTREVDAVHEMPATLSNLTTSPASAGLNFKTNVTIKYNPDDTITDKRQLIWHDPEDGMPLFFVTEYDYSNLKNLGESEYLYMKDRIYSNYAFSHRLSEFHRFSSDVSSKKWTLTQGKGATSSGSFLTFDTPITSGNIEVSIEYEFVRGNNAGELEFSFSLPSSSKSIVKHTTAQARTTVTATYSTSSSYQLLGLSISAKNTGTSSYSNYIYIYSVKIRRK